MLAERTCQPCRPGTPPIDDARAGDLLAEIPGWKIENTALVRDFTFKNYYETTAFVNAAVWIAHREDHHPDIQFGYKTCRIRYSTHSIGGLSENDFICAARINALLRA
jgi:4a-hydroxytetrahydrobiopterin dehydratase